MITLTVLPTRQLSFAALALLVDAATFTRTLKQIKKHVASITFPCNHKEFTGLTPPVPIPLSPQLLLFSLRFCGTSQVSQDATRPLPGRARPRWETSVLQC